MVVAPAKVPAGGSTADGELQVVSTAGHTEEECGEETNEAGRRQVLRVSLKGLHFIF